MTTALARCLPSRTAALLPLPLRAQLPPTFADPRHQPRTVRTPGRVPSHVLAKVLGAREDEKNWEG